MRALPRVELGLSRRLRGARLRHGVLSQGDGLGPDMRPTQSRHGLAVHGVVNLQVLPELCVIFRAETIQLRCLCKSICKIRYRCEALLQQSCTQSFWHLKRVQQLLQCVAVTLGREGHGCEEVKTADTAKARSKNSCGASDVQAEQEAKLGNYSPSNLKYPRGALVHVCGCPSPERPDDAPCNLGSRMCSATC